MLKKRAPLLSVRGRSLKFGFKSILLLISALCISRTARASVIVNDTWSDGTRSDPASPTYSENGTDSDSDGSIESAWFASSTAALTASTNHLTMTQLPTSSTSYTTYFTPEASPVNLANVGDSMKLTWVFTPNVTTAQANTSQNFRLAVVHTPTGSRLAADGTPASATFTGYAMFMNMSTGTAGTPENLGSSGPFRLETRNAVNSDILGTSSNWTGVGTTGAASGTHGYDSGTQYTYTMTLTHNATGGLDIVSKMTGGTLGGTGAAQVTFTDPIPNGSSFLFDTFSIRPSSAASTADTFDTTNFKVEFTPASSGTTPEPASLALICLAGLGFARRRGQA